ncbi:hypothetical protein GSI_07302 [Ganoderma sinense ZZ0214-1]|uniref:Transporter n=1 Tax=Ganoderma sinense ZZ0214-1 TaxID=1077348 RepID=A0A2G8SA36_9APHY|nr:hypothetical protein GSI_07302 [Ganoderma sinense ZZ0214-1]
MDGPHWSTLSLRLAAVLEAAIHLEYLHLSASIRDPVFTAASKVASLQELIINVDSSEHSSCEALRKFLTILRSPLRRLRIEEDYREDSGGIRASFIHDLIHFASTLEALELSYLVLDMHPSSVKTPFAAIRSLNIVSSCSFPPRSLPAETLQCLFPNLDHVLQIGELAVQWEGGEQYDRLAHRARSKTVQTIFTWSKLDHFICDTNAAFVLALRCPIRRMEISMTWLPEEEQDLAEILRYNPPQKLLLSLDATPINRLVFPPEAADKLTHLLSVQLNFKRPNRQRRTTRPDGIGVDIPWNQFMTNLIDMLKPLRLIHFRLILNYRASYDPPSWATRQPSDFDATLDTGLTGTVIPSETDFQPTAVRLLDAMPTLQYFFLAVSRYSSMTTSRTHHESRWESSKAWRVVSASGGPHPSDTVRSSCEELDSVAAEIILSREELKLQMRHGVVGPGSSHHLPSSHQPTFISPSTLALISEGCPYYIMNTAPLPSPPQLTYDILLHIISLYSSAGQAVPLIATCRVLYHEGAKIALKKPVTISGAAQLALFLKFLHAENSSRCQHLKQLELGGFRVEAELVQGLLETLPLLVGLQKLRLVNAEELLTSDPAIPTTFAALTSLRDSPLVSVAVDCITDFDDDSAELWDRLTYAEWPNYHPMALLANVSPTLEELQCVACSTISDWDVAVPTTVYPNMRKLSIEIHELPLRIDPFIRAFPNLTNLNVRTQHCYDHLDLEDLRTSHEGNVGQQLASCGTWTHLEHFTGALVDLYAIGLTCRIGRITLTDNVKDELGLDMLATVLRYARPLHLKFRGISYSLLEDSQPGFISMLRSEGASDLVNLDMCINFREEDWDKDWRITVDNLVSALTALRLKFLALRFDTPDLDLSPMEKYALELSVRLCEYLLPMAGNFQTMRAPLDTAKLLSSLDVDALVARLESIPSLEAALVVLPGSGTGGEKVEKTITIGTSPLPGWEQWRRWLHDKNRFVI